MTISASIRKTGLAVAFICAAGALAPLYTQAPDARSQTPVPAPRSPGDGGKSVGRGWPVPVPPKTFDGYPEDDFVGAVTPWYYTTSATATGGKIPEGVQPLARDIFTSKDFYLDRGL